MKPSPFATSPIKLNPITSVTKNLLAILAFLLVAMPTSAQQRSIRPYLPPHTPVDGSATPHPLPPMPHDPPPANDAAPAQPGRPDNLQANANPLEAARAYFAEKSWQLVVQTAEQASTGTLSEDARRELVYLQALSLTELRNNDAARALYEQLIQDNSHDAWAGRAHWRLQPGLGSGWYGQSDDEKMLLHLHEADKILTDLKTDDLDEFYLDVINSSLITRHYDDEKDRNYILSFFDKITPLLDGQNEKLAEVKLKRERALDAQTKRTQDERLAGWRGIVSEYPRTRAAAQAQWNVAQFYISKREFTPALYELNLLVNQFAGTDQARDASEEIKKIKRAEAMFKLAGQYLPGERIEFDLATRNVDDVQLTAVPFSILDQLKQQKATRLDLSKIKGDAALTEKVSIDRAENYHTTTRTVSLKLEKAGVYVVTASADGEPLCNAMLIVSDLALVGNNGPQGYEFWAVEAKTGRPKQGVEITVAHNIKRDKKWLSGQEISYFSSFKELQSNSDGFADFAPSDNDSRQMVAVARDGDNVALLDNVYWADYARHGSDQAMVYTYTDRPVYRPEQRVYWRAIVRERDNGTYKIPSAHAYKITITDPQGNEVFKKEEARLSEFGTVDGDFTLAAGAPLGMYQISVRDESAKRGIGGGNFRVEEYKKPEFLVNVEAASDFAKIGETVQAKVSADYLFGSPVTDASVEYTVRRRKRFHIMWDNISWALDHRDLGWFEDKAERPPVLHGSSGVIVAEGDGKLNDQGEFTLSFDASVPDEEIEHSQAWPRPMSMRMMIWPPRIPNVWDFQVEVTVTDASRRNIDASQVIPVGLKALSLAAKTDRNIVTPGDNARVELKSFNLAEKPVPTSGTLYVEKLEWNDTEERDDITTVSTQDIAIDSSGSLIVTWRVPQDLHGRLRFAYVVDDPFGGESVAYANFTSASPDDTDIAARYQGVEIVSDRNQYAVGDSARIMILSEFSDAVAWYWIDTGSGSLDKKVMPLPHRTNFVTIPITDALVPNVQVHIVAVRDKKIILDDLEIIVPPTRKIVNVQVIPGAEKVEPGTTGTVTIRATDYTGAPVSAEFSLSVFDQAITYIAPDMREDIRRYFYGTKRPLRSNIQQSLNSALDYGEPLVEDIFRYLDYTQPQPPGMPVQLAESGFQMYGRGSVMMEKGVAAMAPAPMMADAAMPMTSRAVQQEAAPQQEQPTIRADFRDSMFWSPTVRTDANGSATVEIKYPDSLTTWQIDAIGITPETRVGNATTQTVARKKILVRLQSPRFFRERDQLVVTGNLHNYSDAAIQMNATLRATGIQLENGTTMPLSGNANFVGNTQTVSIPAGGEQRVDWKVSVPTAAPGEAILNLMATSDAGGDAMQTTVPLLPHGIDKFVAWNGTSQDANTTGATVRTSGTGRVITRTISLPDERIKPTSKLDIFVNPSLAYSIREALPYMIEFPYGCVEQTMSRFMPAIVASRAFDKLGYPADVTLRERLPKVTADSIQRLRDMQLPSGGWGWWANDSENINMTAYVVYGLTLAKQAGVDVDASMYARGLTRLTTLRDDITSDVAKALAKPRALYSWPIYNRHDLMYAEYVLTLNGKSSPQTLELLWNKRDNLSARGLAMLARTLGQVGRTADADVVLRNMLNIAVITPENNTLHWGKRDSGWLWYDDAVEATAVGLMAYLELHPSDPAVDRAMKWLVLNRQGSRWKSTRDSAHAVLALTQYMLQKKEAATTGDITVSVAGKPVKTMHVSPANFWDFDGHITLRGDEIPSGDFPVEIAIDASSKIYYSIYAEYFTLEEGIQPAGNEIYVGRTYELLRREQTTETVNGKSSLIWKENWVPLKDGDALQSGDEIRANLTIKSLNDYEYLVFEDPKPAGFEPVDLQSGSRYGDGLCSNMELRDAWVAFFITNLRQGEYSLSYRMRAEIPGEFHAMPTTGKAMYFPPLRANAQEAVLKVEE